MTQSFNDYQIHSGSTAIYPVVTGWPGKIKIQHTYLALGLNGEAGEVSDKIKKIIRDKDSYMTKEDVEAIGKELGDVLWYLARLAAELGLDLQDIADRNYVKLIKRQEDHTISGFGDDR